MADHLLTHPDRDVDDLVAALARADVELGAEGRVERTVLDTFDGHLHAAGLRLELRAGPGTELVLLDRSGAPSAHLPVGAAPVVAGDLPPGPFAARVATATGGRRLLPVLRLSSRVRTGHRRDRRGKATVIVEVHTHLTAVGDHATRATLPAWAAEVHGAIGHDVALQLVVDRLAGRGFWAHPGDLVTAAASALGVRLDGRTASPTVPLDPAEPAREAFRRVLLNLTDAIEANLLGTIDDTDPEFLHELRVAVRRSRSVLSRAKGVLPDDVRTHQRVELGWLGELTGPARDLDVYLIEWDGYLAPLEASAAVALLPVRAELARRRDLAHEVLAEALRSDRYEEMVAGWEGWLRAPGDGGAGPGNDPVGPLVARRLMAAQARLLREGRAITPASPPEALHDLRKDAKRLRYLLECFGSLLAAKPRKAFVQRLKALQDNLGAHQDAEVHVGLLRELAEALLVTASAESATLLAMGQLIEVLDRRRLAERSDFEARFAAYDTPATARALDALVDPARSIG